MRWLGATLICVMVFAGAYTALAQQPTAEEAAADKAAANAPAPPLRIRPDPPHPKR